MYPNWNWVYDKMGYANPPCLFHLQVTSESNFDFVLQWVSMSDFVGQPPTKKEVQAIFKIDFKNHIFWDIFFNLKLIPVGSTALG